MEIEIGQGSATAPAPGLGASGLGRGITGADMVWEGIRLNPFPIPLEKQAAVWMAGQGNLKSFGSRPGDVSHIRSSSFRRSDRTRGRQQNTHV